MNFFKKGIIFFILSLLSSFISINTYCQTNYTFCYGSISITMIGGGNAEMVRYNSSGSVVKRETGTFNLYGAGGRTEVLKIQFQGKEYRYDLIRDGYGKPSIIIDIEGRKYNICNSTSVESSQSGSISNFLSEPKYPKEYLSDFIIVDKFAITKQNINRVQGSWYEAMMVCKDLGEGWHLPTYTELVAIYNSKENSNALFSDGKYWSSTECIIKEGQGNFAQNFEGAFVVDFKRGSYREKLVVGELGGRTLLNLNYVRAVKELTQYEIDEFKKTGKLPPKPKKIIETLRIGNILVAKGIVTGRMNLIDAKKACQDLGEEWRLPDLEELNLIYNNKNGIVGLAEGEYWSSSKARNGKSWCQSISSGDRRGEQYESDIYYETKHYWPVKTYRENVTPLYHTIQQIDMLEITATDFLESFTWEDAKKACTDLGEGWRLPTIDELNILFLNFIRKNKISNFENRVYWSSTAYTGSDAWVKDFNDGTQGASTKEVKYFVRPVKNANKPILKKVIKSIIIDNLEIALSDNSLNNQSAWNVEDAIQACENLGDGWRVPNDKELQILYENRIKIGGFKNYFYWSSTIQKGYTHYYYSINFGNPAKFPSIDNYFMSQDAREKSYPVRMVRTVK